VGVRAQERDELAMQKRTRDPAFQIWTMPSIPLLRQYFRALGFHTALLWPRKVNYLVIRYNSNIFY
jgi:hypothetical protein